MFEDSRTWDDILCCDTGNCGKPPVGIGRDYYWGRPDACLSTTLVTACRLALVGTPCPPATRLVEGKILECCERHSVRSSCRICWAIKFHNRIAGIIVSVYKIPPEFQRAFQNAVARVEEELLDAVVACRPSLCELLHTCMQFNTSVCILESICASDNFIRAVLDSYDKLIVGRSASSVLSLADRITYFLTTSIMSRMRCGDLESMHGHLFHMVDFKDEIQDRVKILEFLKKYHPRRMVEEDIPVCCIPQDTVETILNLSNFAVLEVPSKSGFEVEDTLTLMTLYDDNVLVPIPCILEQFLSEYRRQTQIYHIKSSDDWVPFFQKVHGFFLLHDSHTCHSVSEQILDKYGMVEMGHLLESFNDIANPHSVQIHVLEGGEVSRLSNILRWLDGVDVGLFQVSEEAHAMISEKELGVYNRMFRTLACVEFGVHCMRFTWMRLKVWPLLAELHAFWWDLNNHAKSIREYFRSRTICQYQNEFFREVHDTPFFEVKRLHKVFLGHLEEELFLSYDKQDILTQIFRLMKLCVELRLMTERFDLLDIHPEEVVAALGPKVSEFNTVKQFLTSKLTPEIWCFNS